MKYGWEGICLKDEALTALTSLPSG
ncbi:MAG: hypothetical protein LUQ29_02835 [Methylococcaceae bacterium]|nr:hypothetical protein [Methylococcaceae bacterium]